MEAALAKQRESKNTNDYDLKNIQKRIENISDDDSLDKRCSDAELLRDLYMRNGKEQEARELNEKIQEAKRALKEREAPKFDWDNPSEEMIENAKRAIKEREPPKFDW